jgi:hypothetical protein
MDDGEVDQLWEQNLFEENGTCELPSISSTLCSIDSLFDEVFESTQTCTHTHTCNPPGPDNTHTHTCYHTHTQLLATGDKGDELADKSGIVPAGGNKKCSLGNKVAVRKYREKKKAHTAHLEEQVNQLKVRNQQLMKRLQEQACLEAEVFRLRSLLAEFRGRIDAEIGGFPAQKPCLNNQTRVALSEDCNVQPLSGGYCVGTVNIPCATDLPCLHTTAASGS